MAVGSHRQIGETYLRQTGYEILHARPHQGLAAGHANFLDPQVAEYSAQTLEFRPGQNLVMLLIIFRVGRAAINAAVSYRNSQVGDLSAELILQRHLP